jgi:hypothetical protein
MEIPQKLVWLASYPKSGNTWFRAFLTALSNDGNLDINGLKTDGIFSSRKIFDEDTDINSALLYDNEIKAMQADIFNHLAYKTTQQHLFMKVHDAYILKEDGRPLIPTEGSRCAIYFIRNPLDIATSLANHKDSTIDEAIELMNDTGGAFSKQEDNLNVNIQLKQLMLDWSGHVQSWTTGVPFPVLVLRYEDMLTDTYNSFSKALKFIGIEVTQQQIETAINASSFEQLQQKEKEVGFVEKNKSTTFFRKGMAGGWKNELSEQQIENIITRHKKAMSCYNY